MCRQSLPVALPVGPTPAQEAVASIPARSAESWAMPALTRRRDPDANQETWLIHYDDIRVGSIAMRAGVRTDKDQWSGVRIRWRPSCEKRETVEDSAYGRP
jgi:hypothetical protein